jgi:peptidyl-prolyl cis-trans isomerase-like protein 2
LQVFALTLLARYITHSEWQNDYGGKKQRSERSLYKPLSFDCCALSFQPFEDPVMSPQGYVYDILYGLIPQSVAD